jgi:hypothetical protein
MRQTVETDTLSDQLFHDTRAVHDTAMIRFDQDHSPDVENSKPWVVVRITAAPGSGSARELDTAVDIRSGLLISTRTGQPVSGENTQTVIGEEGTWQVVLTLEPFDHARYGTFSWREPVSNRERKLRPCDVYSPFAKGGVILCKIHPEDHGPSHFNPVHLIPAGWEQSLEVGYDIVRENRRVFYDPLTPDRQTALVRLVSAQNPIAALIAFRQLLNLNRVDAELLHSTLFRLEGFRRALFVYLTAAAPPEIGEDLLRRELTFFVENATTAPQQRFIGLALLALDLLRPEVNSRRPWILQLPHILRRRLVGTDEYLDQILALEGA